MEGNIDVERIKQINAAAKEYIINEYGEWALKWMGDCVFEYFVQGALWADNNPKTC